MESPVVPSTDHCGRIPLAVLCWICSFLDLDSHVAVSQTSHYCRRAALLPEASCQDVAVAIKWSARVAHIDPRVLRQRPRVVRCGQFTSTSCLDAICAWLAHAPQLHTLHLHPTSIDSMLALSRLGTLRHLALEAPSTQSVVSALRACGTRLRTLRLSNCHRMVMTNPVTLAESLVPYVCVATTFAAQLATCTALESLAVEAFCSDHGVLAALGSVALPALRSLSLIHMTAKSNLLHVLSVYTGLSSLCYRVGSRFAEAIVWPRLPGLRALELGNSIYSHEVGSARAAFPLIGRLSLACVNPAALVGFVALTDLTLIDSADDVLWADFARQCRGLLSCLVGLTDLAIQCSRKPDMSSATTWHMPRVTHLTLRLLLTTLVHVSAPLLRFLRVVNLSAKTAREIADESPRLEVIEHDGSPVATDGSPGASTLGATIDGRVRLIGRSTGVALVVVAGNPP